MRTIGIVISVSLFVLLISSAEGLPRYALMAGVRCGSCHVNPTGGQMRSEYGISYSLNQVPITATRDSEFTFNGKLTENITIGGDYRSQLIYDTFTKSTTFQSMTTSIYGSVTLSKKVLFYFKTDLVNGTYGSPYGGTEVFGVAKVLPGNWYVKGGTFLPDYGWKFDDHSVFTRGGNIGYIQGLQFADGLIFTPNYKDIGVEVGGYVENLMITAGLFNGSGDVTPIDFRKDKAYSAKIEYMGSLSGLNYRVGASGYGFRSYKMGGFTAGISTGDVVILAEADWTHHRLRTTSSGPVISEGTHALAANAELDYQVLQGFWLVGSYGMFDPVQGSGNDDATPAANSIQRITVGSEFFPYSFVEVRPQFRYNIEQPKIDNNEFLVQMHLWF